MKFKQGTRRRALEYEKDLVSYWKNNKTFQKSVDQRPADNAYVFYDGPPFITGVPHHGNLLAWVIKDAVPRYWAMKGKHVERVWGWDCHGLPAEVATERKLGIEDKRDVGTKVSLEEYIVACRDNMVQTGSLWEDTVDRVGRWVDFKGAYKTMDKDYMESVWWAFKTLYEKGKIYEGEKVLLYCVRDATPISKAEVAMDNSYQDDTDPSVFVKFKLSDTDSYLLAWTTTPWTLHANTAIAVNKNITYTEVKIDGQNLIIAKKLLDKVLTNEKHEVLKYEVVRTLKGSELIGKDYEPLFEDALARKAAKHADNAYKIWHADFVSEEEGTGIAHEAPAYGEDDYELAKKLQFPLVMDTQEEGYYASGPWKGEQIWEVNKQIAKTLHEQGVVWKINYITHSYPHCHRCQTKLMYRAHPSWFMDIDGQRTEMLEQNGEINWFPEHIKYGRSAKTIQSAPDWNLSRDRFWATAMPVWKGTDKAGKEHIKVVGSYAELKELSGVELEDYHRPWVDDIKFTLDGVEYTRIDKVMDCWFESGSMPFAQFHYPFENIDKFEKNFPGDFVVEYVAQVRAWFYYMEAISVGIFGDKAFHNVIVTGTVAGNDGRKMSKSFGNYTDPNELMDQYSADSLRFLLLSSPLLNGEDFSLQDKEVADVARKLSMIWNMYDFFTLYADVDGWEWDGKLVDPGKTCKNPLDEWIISRVHQLSTSVDKHMRGYDIPNATKPMLEFIDDASNWYVRRSRRRFWKSDSDADKQQAYQTLHYILVQLSMIMAPFTPFLAEELYRNLTGGESVHLLDWPEAGHINELLVEEMAATRTLITEGLAQRAKEGIKVRQPLRQATIAGPKVKSLDRFDDILKEELNVKTVLYMESDVVPGIVLNTKLDDELRKEGLMREVIRQVQNTRKQADLQVDDRIHLSLTTEDETLSDAIKSHHQEITAETLAPKLTTDTYKHATTVKIEGKELKISLEKHN